MKIIRSKENPYGEKPYGRETKVLASYEFSDSIDSVIFYHSKLPRGEFDEHFHSESVEFIWFPEGGKITVNGTDYVMENWDGVILEPGDSHGFQGDCGPITHLAVKLPASNDKVSVETK